MTWFVCLLVMARKKDIPAKKAAKEQDGVTSYDVETPLWNRYY